MNYMADYTRDLPLKGMGEYLLASEIKHRTSELYFPQGIINKAIQLAAVAHNDQIRSNRGRLPNDTYLTHPLRNALRALRYGVTDWKVIIAIILHDTVEDGSKVFYEQVQQNKLKASEAVMRDALAHEIKMTFGADVHRIVMAVTNPLPVKGEHKTKVQKRKDYQQKIATLLLTGEADEVVAKLVDIVDNAVGLYHNTAMSDEARDHLARKYLPLMDLFEEALERDDVGRLLGLRGYVDASRHLEKGRTELQKMMS